MPYYNFRPQDLIYSTIETNPKFSTIIYNGKVYLQNVQHSHGEFNNFLSSKQGSLSLNELNLDKVISISGEPPGLGSIYQFVTKDSSRIAFKTVSTSEFDSVSQYNYGDIIKSQYPLTASITRVGILQGSSKKTVSHEDTEDPVGDYTVVNGGGKRKLLALRTTFEKYINLSKHYAFNYESFPHDEDLKNDYLKIINWDKSQQNFGLLEIPSILYGSSIKRGSVSLKYYITGTLAAELQDNKKNGELIQVSGTYNAKQNDGKVAGVVLYNEGFLCLTGSWNLNSNFQDQYVSVGTHTHPSWLYFGVGANDGLDEGVVTGSAFEIAYEGTQQVPTLTMFAHAPTQLLNNSTNPTFVELSKNNKITGSITSDHTTFLERRNTKIKHLSHSRFYDQSGSFDKQVYISKIGIYDEHKNLIAIATLANPVRKTESRDLTFKLKLDF
jgi:hypothetical protein